jgi:hypothetical protein
MACYLLHVLEQQDPRPYDDPAVKDVVGTMPQFYCTKCQPLLKLVPSDAIKCIGRDAPCWMAAGGPPCPEATASDDPWNPKTQF